MTDDDRYKPHRPPAPPRQPTSGEPLFEFFDGHDRILCELRDHGEPYGVEAQFYRNEVFEIGRRFDRKMNPTRPPRDLAIQWAEEHRLVGQYALIKKPSSKVNWGAGTIAALAIMMVGRMILNHLWRHQVVQGS